MGLCGRDGCQAWVFHCIDEIREQKELEQLTWFVSREKKRREERGEKERGDPEMQGRQWERQTSTQILCGRVLWEKKSWEQLLCCVRYPISLHLDAIAQTVSIHHYCTYWWNIDLKKKRDGERDFISSLHCIKRLFETLKIKICF